MASGKAVQLKGYGAQNLQLEVVPATAPASVAAGKVLVEMKMCPVNPADIFSIMGVYPGFQPAALPATPGLEGMGVVKAVGEGVTTVAVGTRVVPFFIFGANGTVSGNGSWRQFVEVEADLLFPVPDGVPDESAAQFVVNPFTAWQMIHELAVPKGEWLVQAAAGSTLGKQVIQMAKHLGIKTANVVRRREQAAELTALGADLVLVQDEDDIAGKVKEVTGGKGAWGAIDPVAGPMTAKLTGALRNGGTCLIYGAMAGLSFEGSVVDCLFRGVTVKGYWVTASAQILGMPAIHAMAKDLWPLFTAGVVKPDSGKVFPVDEVVKAVEESNKVARGGKVLIKF